MKWLHRAYLFVVLTVACALPMEAQGKRKVIIVKYAAGPGGTDMQSILALVNSQRRSVGHYVVTGDAWRDEEVQHTLRLMEIIGTHGIFLWCRARRFRWSTVRNIEKGGKTLWKAGVSGRVELLRWATRLHGPLEIPPDARRQSDGEGFERKCPRIFWCYGEEISAPE